MFFIILQRYLKNCVEIKKIQITSCNKVTFPFINLNNSDVSTRLLYRLNYTHSIYLIIKFSIIYTANLIKNRLDFNSPDNILVSSMLVSTPSEGGKFGKFEAIIESFRNIPWPCIIMPCPPAPPNGSFIILSPRAPKSPRLDPGPPFRPPGSPGPRGRLKFSWPPP